MAVISEGSTAVSVVEMYKRRNETGLSQAVIVTFRITPLVSSTGHVPESGFYGLTFTIDLPTGDVLISLLCPLLSLCFLAVTERVNLTSKRQIYGILQVHASLTLNRSRPRAHAKMGLWYGKNQRDVSHTKLKISRYPTH